MGEVLKGTITPHTRLTDDFDKSILGELPETMVSISDPEIRERLPELEDVQITSSEYFMNNRDMFSNFINKLYQPYRDEIMDETEELDCDTMGAETKAFLYDTSKDCQGLFKSFNTISWIIIISRSWI